MMRLHTAMHPAYRLRVTERSGVVAEDELTRPAVGPSGPSTWPILTVALGARAGAARAPDIEIASRLSALLAALRADGVFGASVAPEALVDAVPRELRALSAAVDDALVSRSDRPTAVDLTAAVGRSAAHVGRLF